MLKWYHWTLFAIVVVIALLMSWYSMMDLAHNGFNLPWLLSASVSVAFDVGAILLGLMAIEQAKTQDSKFWTEFWTFAFVVASIYINVGHAIREDYGLVGMIMFGAAPVIAGVLLKVMLSFVTRQARRESGRLVNRLPSVGWLTWLRYRKESWRLMSIAMEKRLRDAASQLDMADDRHAIFAGQAEVQKSPVEVPEAVQELTEAKTPELVQATVISSDLIPARTEEDIDEIVYTAEFVTVPEWLPKEPTMSLGRIAEICLENGQSDTNTILRWAQDIKHSDVKYGSMYKAVQRAKEKLKL